MPERWIPSLEDYIDVATPNAEIDATMVERIAAGSAEHDEVLAWVRHRTGQS